MKKIFSFAICIASLFIWSCNNSSTAGTDGDTTLTTTVGGDTGTSVSTNTNAVPSAPLSKMDSSFVMDAAVAGMMEVEAGNLAQQNASNPRVKSFGSMMVSDHSKANSELTSLATAHGVTVPTALPADKQKHLDGMKKMTGKAFDRHYMDMMVNDHKKVIDKFKMAAEKCDETHLKSWASSTLPTLEKHRDSAMAVRKGL